MDQRKLIVAALIKAGRRDLARAVADDYAARLLRTEKDLAAVTKMLTAMRLEGEFFGATDFQLLGDGAVQRAISGVASQLMRRLNMHVDEWRHHIDNAKGAEKTQLKRELKVMEKAVAALKML